MPLTFAHDLIFQKIILIKIFEIAKSGLTREWYREDFRCVDATRRGQARDEGRFIDYPAQRLLDKAQ